jgi:arylformamidase
MNLSWRNMDRATLDAAYSNGDPTADFQTRSAAFYATHYGELDLRYGHADLRLRSWRLLAKLR